MAAFLETLYLRYNDTHWLDPDPLLIVRRYTEAADMELVGLVASALALGTVKAIMAAVETVLLPFGPHPAQALAAMDDSDVESALHGFCYRFFDSGDMVSFFCAARNLSNRSGTLEKAFLEGDDGSEQDYSFVASRFVRSLLDAAPSGKTWRSNLFPDPARGSAAKRVFLYLRWMVRHDAVDPGPWRNADPARLVVPLDTHMAAACRRLGLLTRSSTDLKAAKEAAASFREFCPDDPVRYDFCMTRPGIHPDTGYDLCLGCFD
ncbi:TIGR02757 family protein [Spirochaetota bacterium]